MKYLYILLLAGLAAVPAKAQTYMTRNGEASFYSKTPMEDIKADNKQVYAAIDRTKKTVAFTLLMRNFLFEKQLMQDHFNENYAESDKFPRAQFAGSYTGDVPTTPGTYNVQVSGKLTIHGVTKDVQMPATLEVQGDKLTGKTQFSVDPNDYNIKIPALVKEKIASKIDVKVNAACQAVK